MLGIQSLFSQVGISSAFWSTIKAFGAKEDFEDETFGGFQHHYVLDDERSFGMFCQAEII